jgi:23S rRNA pseudouridine2605 synthase/23S rRNA pseudouridine2604 synthase
MRLTKGPKDPKIRLQKYLAQQGYGSRRTCETFIEQGYISVNGEVVTKLGTKVDPDKDIVTVSDELAKKQANTVKRYIMLNKPAGVVTTCASHLDDKTVLDIIDVPERVFPIGRLDKPTTGLLILTNDGTITHDLLHPSKAKEKEYIVTVGGYLTKARLDKLRGGIKIFGADTNPTKVFNVEGQSFHIVLTEGKNRQIRRICRKVGLVVTKLHRIRMNKLVLDPRLKVGEWRDLTGKELEQLMGRVVV